MPRRRQANKLRLYYAELPGKTLWEICDDIISVPVRRIGLQRILVTNECLSKFQRKCYELWHADYRFLSKTAIQTGHAIGYHVNLRRTNITLMVCNALEVTFAVIVLGVLFKELLVV